MDLRTLYSIKVFEKIGAPIINALLEKHNTQDADLSVDQAQEMAQLLNVCVKLSNDLSKKFDIHTPEDGDAIKLSLASIVSGFMAKSFLQSGDVPKDKELDIYTKHLETLLNLVGKFEISQDSANRRLRLVESDPLAVTGRTLYDADQIVLKAMDALMPIAEAISATHQGDGHDDIINSIMQALEKRVQSIRQDLYKDVSNESDQSLIELGITRTLVKLYAQSHLKIYEQYKDDEDVLYEEVVKEIWRDADLRISVVVSLTKKIIGLEETVPPQSGVEEKSVKKEENKKSPVIEPVKEETSEPDEVEALEEEVEDEKPASPMSFFKKGDGKQKIMGEKDKTDEEEGEGRYGSGGGRSNKMKTGLKPGGKM